MAVELSRSSGDAARDEQVLAVVRPLAAALEGRASTAVDLAAAIERIEREARGSKVVYRVLPGRTEAQVRVVFLVAVEPETAVAPPVSGVLAGDLAGLPVLYRDEHHYVAAIVNGGLGVYSDANPWFGRPELFNATNPLAGHLPGKSATWTEGSLELGAGFVSRVLDLPLHAFGAVSGLESWSLGQDVYRDDARSYVAIEKGYGGVFHVDRERDLRLKVSAGRQQFTLNDGFLVHQVKGSVNAGKRGASYLGPRLANDFSVLAEAGLGEWSATGFYVDPNEIESLDSNTTFLGLNAKRAFGKNVVVDGTAITIPSSESDYATRQGGGRSRAGLWALGAHLRWRNLLVDGLWLESELAHESHADWAMSAWAGYAWTGWIARTLPWTPSLSYRWAFFSGDDPATSRYERWDPLLSTGLGIWLQGVSFGKLVANSNLETHRVQLNVEPLDTLDVTLDWHLLRAPQLSNLGANPAIANLAAHELGQEITLSLRWALTRRLYLQTLFSCAVPGRALVEIGANATWTTFQASLYWNL